MENISYNKIIPERLRLNKKPYPVHKYNFRSEKYAYIYNESLNDITYWHACLQGLIYYQNTYGTGGFTSWDFYSNSEDECAKEVYKMILKNLKKIARQNKKYDNGHYRRHVLWQKWVDNYKMINNEIPSLYSIV